LDESIGLVEFIESVGTIGVGHGRKREEGRRENVE
jgi:hypothetical protein